MSIRLRCHALMLMLCLGFSGCTPTAETQMDEQRNPHFLAGREKVGALDYKGAVESFERAVEDNPRSALAHFELGVLYERENDYVAALYHFNKALKLRPNGNPADIIRQRIPGCKQELVKADSLAIINPNVLRETENLRAQNATLRSQLEMLQAQLASRPPTPITGAPATAGREATTPRFTRLRRLRPWNRTARRALRSPAHPPPLPAVDAPTPCELAKPSRPSRNNTPSKPTRCSPPIPDSTPGAYASVKR